MTVSLANLGQIERGSVLLLRSPISFTRDHLDRCRTDIADRIGHSEFAVVALHDPDATGDVLTPDELADLDWVYVGSPGVCPFCGSRDVTVHSARPARSCHSCGHRGDRFTPGAAS